MEEVVYAEFKGKPVYKLDGNGQCSCARCEATRGWNRYWTSMCYQYDGKIYCYDCMQKIIKGETNENITK